MQHKCRSAILYNYWPGTYHDKGVVPIVVEKKQSVESPDRETMSLTGQERTLIALLRELEYGEVRIVVKASEIVQIEEKKSIKL